VLRKQGRGQVFENRNFNAAASNCSAQLERSCPIEARSAKFVHAGEILGSNPRTVGVSCAIDRDEVECWRETLRALFNEKP
jgi:hypothetical protein